MRLIDLDEFLRQNCVDRMEGKSCEECKHHVLEVSCERLMEQPTADPVKRGRWDPWDLSWGRSVWSCSECRDAMEVPTEMGDPIYKFCPNCGARMRGDGDE